MTSSVCVLEKFAEGAEGRRASQLKGSSGASSQGLQGASSGLGWLPVPTTLACFSDLPCRDELSSPVGHLQMWMDGCQCSGRVTWWGVWRLSWCWPGLPSGGCCTSMWTEGLRRHRVSALQPAFTEPTTRRQTPSRMRELKQCMAPPTFALVVGRAQRAWPQPPGTHMLDSEPPRSQRSRASPGWGAQVWSVGLKGLEPP